MTDAKRKLTPEEDVANDIVDSFYWGDYVNKEDNPKEAKKPPASDAKEEK